MPGQNLKRRGISVCRFFTLITLLLLPASEKILADDAEEYTMKAAFILNFARYTKWPEGAYADDASPCLLSVAGDSRMQPAFQVVSGKKIGSRELEIRFIDTPEGIVSSHMVFISRNLEAAKVSQLLEAVKGKPVVTIGETRKFIRQGGMVNFFSRNGRLNFEINMEVVRQQNIKFSSRLLKLAILVGEK